MKYYKTNGIHIAEVPVSAFKVVLRDAPKKSAASAGYCNAGFFGNFHEGKDKFTLPVGHLVCDYAADSPHVRHYCGERGKLRGDKLTFDSGKWSYANQFYGKAVSTLVVADGRARVEDFITLPEGLDYAIAGVPILRGGADVKFATYVRGQGWDGSTLYATWHTFLGLKQDRGKVYVLAMKTTTGNMILSAEAFRKFKALGFEEVLKLDGGGSFHLNVGGKTAQSTLGNRRINTVITFGSPVSGGAQNNNPYPVPARILVRGCTGDDVKWLQFELNKAGFGNVTGFSIDGSFGPATVTAVKNFQAANRLVTDGSVGPATRSALLSLETLF